ncbi:hypothetical protein K458DRAFT_431133 [Lentithecium fluviatile CBS 122367]|uniref:Uncharacterized protein n=1 Tax=Lentithecium fluviatile CBS 122367 TaxID=1168545 RepID=A0A6G1J3R7_9PLEO|nr:hypothetical protein K458DRAFT_431133 [Lentithecium fluviatile CBS 122367]
MKHAASPSGKPHIRTCIKRTSQASVSFKTFRKQHRQTREPKQNPPVLYSTIHQHISSIYPYGPQSNNMRPIIALVATFSVASALPQFYGPCTVTLGAGCSDCESFRRQAVLCQCERASGPLCYTAAGNLDACKKQKCKKRDAIGKMVEKS